MSTSSSSMATTTVEPQDLRLSARPDPTLHSPWLAAWIPDQRDLRLRVSLPCVKWRNIMVATCAAYLLICVLLTTVLYAARRSASVLLFNAAQGFLAFLGFSFTVVCALMT